MSNPKVKKKYLIFSPHYNENSGGVVVLHKLCSLLNDLGYESYLYPHFASYVANKNNISSVLIGCVKSAIRSYSPSFKTNSVFDTPVYKGLDEDGWADWVVIYPEAILGNPLKAKNVVRWFLHNPGYHTGNVFYGANELYFKFNTAISDFTFPGSTTSKKLLKVIHYPLEIYNMEGAKEVRRGTAYCLRKGKGKPIQHDLDDSVLIDDLSHSEIATVFKRVKTFISYDTLTAYSLFAVLCGCESVVIPDDGVSEEEWYPNPADRYGLSYGFSNIEKAKKTAHLVKEYVLNEEGKSVDDVKGFVGEVERYFG